MPLPVARGPDPRPQISPGKGNDLPRCVCMHSDLTPVSDLISSLSSPFPSVTLSGGLP